MLQRGSIGPLSWNFSDCESKGQGHSLVGHAPIVDFTDEVAEGQEITVISQCPDIAQLPVFLSAWALSPVVTSLSIVLTSYSAPQYGVIIK